MSQEGKTILESTLGYLIGFEDGAGDILDHLLTIESKEDLLEYLSQLLGDATPEILEFVDNVGRFQKGEPVTLSATGGAKDVGPNKESSKSSESKKEEWTQSQPQKPQQASTKKYALAARRNKNNKGKNNKVPPPKKNLNNNPAQSIPKNQTSGNNRNQTMATTKTETTTSPPPPESTPRKINTERGEAKVVCGCFGTKHEPLTNCLYCGRISCAEEGYDFCAFCGFLVEQVLEQNPGDAASIHKERLLQFDREFAQRTQIFDDQADYQGPASWMTEKERQEAEDKEYKRLESLKRQKQTLNIAI